MRKLVLFTTGLLLAGFVSAQEVIKDTIKDTVVVAKRSKVNSRDEQFTLVSEMLENKSFVLEANTASDKWGSQTMLNSALNFVMVDSTQSTIQVGDDLGLGPNGVGGITVKGKISGWKLNKNEKRKTFTVEMNVMTLLKTYNVFINITAYGNANATITDNTSNRITFNGQIVPLEDSRVYVGSHL